MRDSYSCPHCVLVYYSKGALTRHKNEEHPTEDNVDLATKFLLKYQEMEKYQRRQVALMFDGRPFSWNVIWIEVHNKTRIGSAVLNRLEAERKL